MITPEEKEKWKGRLIEKSAHQHSFRYLHPSERKKAIEANKFSDRGIGLWRCDGCGRYTWSM